jgi:death-on-curing protein
MDEPTWLSRRVVDAMQRELIAEHRGLHGIRDEGLIDSALSKPRNRWAYEPDADLAELCASYGFGLARNHGYLDGNKRIALAAMHVFTRRNGFAITVSEVEEVAVVLQLAEGSLCEADLAVWIREHLRPI